MTVEINSGLIDENMLVNLNPIRSVYTVLGVLCRNPQIVRNPDMPIAESDFYNAFHKNIFTAINNIAFSDININKITPVDIDNFLAQYPQNYKIWEANNGFDYISNAIENVNILTYKDNYSRLKKFALLRDYVKMGIDVRSIYDYTFADLKQQEKQMRELDKMSNNDIIEHFQIKFLSLRDKWSMGDSKREFKAGDNIDGLLDKLKKSPEMGYPFKNGFYNSVFRGMRQKKFMLRSAGTGVGKTRLSLADMCDIAAEYMYDYRTKQYEKNGIVEPVLFISSELEEEELQTGLIAHISGVDEDVIKKGLYSGEVAERLNRAIEIIKNSPFYIVYIDDFSVSDIESIIEQYIIKHGVKFVAFDYIQMVPKLARTMQEAFAGSLREDQILVQLSSALKLLANKYQVYIVSSTQVNRNAKEHENRDTTSLRGGSATADKVDHGVMVFRTTHKDIEGLKHILDRPEYAKMKPNFCHYVYKNRGGSKVGVILWTRYHGGVIREEELFCTDMDYNLIDVENLQVVFEEDMTKKSPGAHNSFVDEHMNENNHYAGDDVPDF